MVNVLLAGKSLSKLELLTACSIKCGHPVPGASAGLEENQALISQGDAAGEDSAVRAKQMSIQGGIPRSA